MIDPGETTTASVSLRAYLDQRLRPLSLLLGVVILVSAPVAFYVMGVFAVASRAGAVATVVADELERQAQERPRLWRYDTPKVLESLGALAVEEAVERIDVVDETGATVEPILPEKLRVLRRAPLAWASAPMSAGGHEVGRVWVAASTAPVRNDALILAIPFGLLALGLAGLVYWLPLRAMDKAEDRIGALISRLQESQAQLAELNENLEEEVVARSGELATALTELQKKEARLRDLSGRAVSMQESERRAIARDLHDSAGQALTAIRINLQVLGGQLPEGPSRALAEKTMGMVDETLEEIRRAVRVLGPAVLDDVGFHEALRRLCDDMAHTAGFEVELHAGDPEQSLTTALETTLYRIVQEALTNIMRHANARTVLVVLRSTDQRVGVSIRDDGQGFDPDGPAHASRGLLGMRERAELLGGTLSIASVPGDGTTISAEFEYINI